MGRKKAVRKKEKPSPEKTGGDKAAAVVEHAVEPRVKQPAEKPQTRRTRIRQATEFARDTEVSADLSDVVGSSELAEGEGTRKVWERYRKHRIKSDVANEAEISVYGSRTKVSTSKIGKEGKKRIK